MLRKPDTFTCELPSGGTVTCRMNLPIQARLTYLIQQATAELGPIPDRKDDEAVWQQYNAVAATMVAGDIERLAQAGAVVTWAGVLDHDGSVFPFHVKAVGRLPLVDAVAVVMTLVENMDADDAATAAAEEMGAEDPTRPERETASAPG